MLSKLIKHEFKATSRTFLTLYLGIVILTIANKFTYEIQDVIDSQPLLMNMIGTLVFATYIIGLIVIFVATFILIIKRFYDNMIKDEAYLSFTIPTTVGKHIFSKAFVGYVWMISTVIICCASVFVMVYQPGLHLIDGFKELFKIIGEQDMWVYVIKILIVMIISLYSGIVMIYACMSLGQLFTRHRIVGAVVSYIAFYLITQIVNAIFMVTNMQVKGIIDGPATEAEAMGFVGAYSTYMVVLAIAQCVIYTAITHFMLNKKLNLE